MDRRSIRPLLVAAILLLILLTAYRARYAWASHGRLTLASATWITLATDLRDGVFYRPLYGKDGYGGTRYSSLQFVPDGGLVRLGGKILATGYLLAVLATAMLIVGIYSPLRALGVDSVFAICSALRASLASLHSDAYTMCAGCVRRRFVAGLSLTETAYRNLKSRILSRRLSPGAPLFEVPLAVELKMSRTPVREAIRRLAHEGLVDLWPAKGAFVRGVPLQRIREIFEIRLLVEPHVTALACGRIPRERLERVRSALRRICSAPVTTPERYHRVGDELHRLILRFSGNEAMEEWIQKSTMDIDRACHFAMRRPGVAQRFAAQHLTVAEHLLAGNSDGAARAMAEHIASVRDSVMGSQDVAPPSPQFVHHPTGRSTRAASG